MNSRDRCKELDDFAHGLRPPQFLGDVLEDKTMVIEDVMKKNDEFFTDSYEKFMSKKEACEAAETSKKAKDQECKGEEAEIVDLYCKLEKKRRTTCGQYEECFDTKLSKFKSVVR